MPTAATNPFGHVSVHFEKKSKRRWEARIEFAEGWAVLPGLEGYLELRGSGRTQEAAEDDLGTKIIEFLTEKGYMGSTSANFSISLDAGSSASTGPITFKL